MSDIAQEARDAARIATLGIEGDVLAYSHAEGLAEAGRVRAAVRIGFTRGYIAGTERVDPEAGERDSEAQRIEESNEVTGVVIDQLALVWPDLHPVLDLRYGIADALWKLGYRKVAS